MSKILELVKELEIKKSEIPLDIERMNLYLKEEGIQEELPQDYMDFLKEYNGGIPADTVIVDEYIDIDGDSLAFEWFLGFGGSGDIIECTSLDFVGFMPIASAFNNYFLMSLRKEDFGAIYFWHYELDEGVDCNKKVADNFTEFIEKSKLYDNPNESEIRRYIRRDDIKKVEQILNSGIDVNEKNKQGYSLLRDAVRYKNLYMVKLLIKYGATDIEDALKLAIKKRNELGEDMQEIVDYLEGVMQERNNDTKSKMTFDKLKKYVDGNKNSMSNILELIKKLKISRLDDDFDEGKMNQFLKMKKIDYLPEDFVIFLKEYNGGFPIDEVIVEGYDLKYNYFLGFGYDGDILSDIHPIQFKKTYSGDRIFMPIATDGKNNYFVMSLSNNDFGTIYYWNYDNTFEDNLTDGSVKIVDGAFLRVADNFTEFIEKSKLYNDPDEVSARIYIRRGEINKLKQWINDEWNNMSDSREKNILGRELVTYAAIKNQLDAVKILVDSGFEGLEFALQRSKELNVEKGYEEVDLNTISAIEDLINSQKKLISKQKKEDVCLSDKDVIKIAQKLKIPKNKYPLDEEKMNEYMSEIHAKKLPECFVVFLKEYNGSGLVDLEIITPKGSGLYGFSDSQNTVNADEIDNFISFEKVYCERFLGFGGVNDITQEKPEWGDDTSLDDYFMPIAEDKGGNYFIMSLRDCDFGAIYFWHHEFGWEGDTEVKLRSNILDQSFKVADSFVEFLEKMKHIS